MGESREVIQALYLNNKKKKDMGKKALGCRAKGQGAWSTEGKVGSEFSGRRGGFPSRYTNLSNKLEKKEPYAIDAKTMGNGV